MRNLYTGLAVLSLIWGMSFMFIHVLVLEIDPFAMAFWRCVVGSITLLIVLVIMRTKVILSELPIMMIILVAALNYAVPWTLIGIAQHSISSGLSSIANAMTPLMTAVAGTLFFGTILTRKQWLGVFIGFLGIMMIANLRVDDLLSSSVIGILYCVISTICYGFGSHLSRKYLGHMSAVLISFTTLTVSTIMCLIGTLLMNKSIPIPHSSHALWSLFGLGVFGSGLAYIIYYYLIREAGAEFGALVTYIVPFSAITWGVVLLDEQFLPKTFLGLIIILIGVYTASQKKKKIQISEAA